MARNLFLEDYVPLNGINQPVRWTPPEVLAVVNSKKDFDELSSPSSSSEDEEDHEFEWTTSNGVWSLAVTLWEVAAAAERPFDSISDNQFVTTAVAQSQCLGDQLGDIKVTVKD